MRLIRNRPGPSFVENGQRSVVTIGNFDGMHLGHQALLRQCRELADNDETISVVTFDPLPQAFFRPQAAPARLTTVYQKLNRLRMEGADLVWLMRFDDSLSRLSARDFVLQVLVSGLAASKVVIGADFKFGHQREGDVEMLAELGKEFGFSVHIVPAVFVGDQRVSSTVIRQTLAEGDFDQAATYLGRPFRMQGHVVLGKQLGRTLGYPTANLRIRARPCPLTGILAVYARSLDQSAESTDIAQWMPCVSSIGVRPTVGGTEPLLEVHFFDYEGDLYGHHLEVQFVAKLRDEVNFDSIDELVVQMRLDEAIARDCLTAENLPE